MSSIIFIHNNSWTIKPSLNFHIHGNFFLLYKVKHKILFHSSYTNWWKVILFESDSTTSGFCVLWFLMSLLLLLLLIKFLCCIIKGVSTAREVYEVLSHRGWLELFPLFSTVHEISSGLLPPSAIVEYSEKLPRSF